MDATASPTRDDGAPRPAIRAPVKAVTEAAGMGWVARMRAPKRGAVPKLDLDILELASSVVVRGVEWMQAPGFVKVPPFHRKWGTMGMRS